MSVYDDVSYYAISVDGVTHAMRVEPDPDPCDPRENFDTPVHLYTWTRHYGSIDDNPYDEPSDFVEHLLEGLFPTARELVCALLSVEDSPFRIVLADEVTLQTWARTMLSPKPTWLDGPSWPREEPGHDFLQFADEAMDDIIEEAASWPHVMSVIVPRCAILPIYMLDHSDISYSTSSFGDPWDSGQVGWGYVDRMDMEAIDGESDADMLDRYRHMIESELSEYDDYVQGLVWMCSLLDADGSVDDGPIGGFVGDLDNAMLADMAWNFGAWYFGAKSVRELDATDDIDAAEAATRTTTSA